MHLGWAYDRVTHPAKRTVSLQGSEHQSSACKFGVLSKGRIAVISIPPYDDNILVLSLSTPFSTMGG